jgi:putative ABC transport system permease protein
MAALDPGLPFETAATDDGDRAEAGVWAWGSIGDDEIEAWGLRAGSGMFDADLRSGRWVASGTDEIVVSAGYAERRDIELGAALDVDLASGTRTYTVVGLVDDHNRSVYLDRDVLAEDLGSPGHANVIWSASPSPEFDAPVAVELATRDEVMAADGAGRDAIVVIFGAIGAIVAGVAALAVMSSMIVSLFERRHELAALQALGARRRRLRSLLARELLPLGLLGVAAGLPLGALGTRAIIGSFESSNAVDIGVVDATGSVPWIVGATLLALAALAGLVVRSAARRPIAVTLRGAA